MDPLRELLTLRRGPLSFLVLVGAIGSVGSGIALLALPFFLVDRGFTLSQVGVLYALVAGAEVLAQVFASRSVALQERSGLALALLVASTLAWPALLVVHSPLAFVAVLALASAAGTAAGPGVQVLLARARGTQDASISFAASGLLTALGSCVGVVVGGVLLPHGYVVAFYGAAVVSLLGVALTTSLLLATLRDAPPMATRLRPARVEVARTWRRASRLERRLGRAGGAWTGAWVALHALLFGTSLAVYPFFLPRHLVERGVALPWLGVVVAASWFTFALAQPLGAWAATRLGRARPVAVASLVAAAVLNALLLAPGLPAVIAAWVALGVADGMGRPLVRAMLANAAPPGDLASAFGWMGAAETTARIAGPYAIAAAALWGGIEGAFVLVSLLVLASAVPLLLLGARAETHAAGGAAPA